MKTRSNFGSRDMSVFDEARAGSSNIYDAALETDRNGEPTHFVEPTMFDRIVDRGLASENRAIVLGATVVCAAAAGYQVAAMFVEDAIEVHRK